MKNTLPAFCLLPFMAVAGATTGFAAERCKPAEPIDAASITMPPEVKIPAGHVLHSAARQFGCAYNFENNTRTPTDGRTLHVITVPQEYKNIKNPSEVGLCGGLVGIRDNIDVTYEIQPKYILRSNEQYSITIESYSMEELKLGQEFLDAQGDCSALADHLREYASRRVLGVAPIFYERQP